MAKIVVLYKVSYLHLVCGKGSFFCVLCFNWGTVMTISLFSLDMIDPLSEYLDVDDRSRLAEVSKEGYQMMNNTKIWQALGLRDFIRDGEFWTMREIFDLKLPISEEVIKAAMVEFAKMIPSDSSGDFSLWERLEATAGEWRILLELFKRGAPFLSGEVLESGDGVAREVYGNALEAFTNKGYRPMVAFLLKTGIFFSDERHFKAIEAEKRMGVLISLMRGLRIIKTNQKKGFNIPW